MRRSRGSALVVVALWSVLAVACSSGDGTDGVGDGTDGVGDGTDGVGDGTDGGASGETLPGDDVHLNEIQVLGSHNSYHLRAQPEVAAALAGLVPELWVTLDYTHQPITDQLEKYKVRQFELDVLPDPDGGLYATPAALELLGLPAPAEPKLSEPGFKVQHAADIDFNSSCVTFVDCLSEIEQWSGDHPDHLPIMVMVETKGDDVLSGAGEMGIDLGTLGVEFAEPPAMTPELYDGLEAEVLAVFDEGGIITPDDVRGRRATLEDAVLRDGWPTIGESRGKVLFSLVDTGEARETYVADAPALQGRLFFTSSEPGRPDAAFLRVDDSLEDQGRLEQLVLDGYLIRTRTDEPGVHAPAADTTLRDSAFASGAQYLSTDFYQAHPGTDYVVQLPGGGVARCDPVNAPAGCSDADFATG